MASAVREAIRTPARMESENVRDQHLEAGDHTMSPALQCLRRAKAAQGPADWLSGINAGLRGDAYIYPANVQDRLAWSAGFIEGAGRRLQRLARTRIAPPSFALPLWWQP
jgi:hypothetical protein